MVKLYAFNVNCPHCKKSLMNPYQQIKDKPSIKMKAKYGDKEGSLRLCSFYGCYEHESDLDFPEKAVVEFFCPSCNEKLTTQVKCDVCEAPLVEFSLELGGKAQVCSRKGCDNHYIAFKDLSTALQAMEEEYGHGS